MKQLFWAFAFIFFTVGLYPSQGYAEIASQIGQQYKQPLQQKSIPYSIEAPELLEETDPDLDEKTFLVSRVEIQGAPEGVDFSAFKSTLEGNTVGFKALTAAAQSMTRHLRNEGYLLSHVILPPQKIKDGQLHYTVVNGYIDQILYQGDVQIIDEELRAILETVRHKKPLDRETLERAMILLAQVPGVDIKVVFKASDSAQDATDLIVTVTEDWGSFSAGINNEARKELGPWQAYSGIILNDVFGQNGRLNLIGVKSLERYKMQHIGLGYDVPLNKDGLMLQLQAQASQTRPSGALRILRQKNQYQSLSVGLTYPFILGRHERLEGEVLFQAAENDSNARAIGSRKKDHVRLLQGALTYDFADHLGGTNVWKASIVQGISGGFGASHRKSQLNIRAQSQFDFFKVMAEVHRTQDLGDGLSALLHMESQLATHILPSSQRFYFGGKSYNQGYEVGAQGADSGINAAVGLSYTVQSDIGATRFYTNIGQGYGWIRRPTADEKHHLTLASLDIGAEHRIKELNGVFYVAYGRPLKKRLFGQKARQRVYAGMRISW